MDLTVRRRRRRSAERRPLDIAQQHIGCGVAIRFTDNEHVIRRIYGVGAAYGPSGPQTTITTIDVDRPAHDMMAPTRLAVAARVSEIECVDPHPEAKAHHQSEIGKNWIR